MSSEMIQIIVLAAIAIFLVLRLRNVLGTRGGFERPEQPLPRPGPLRRPQVVTDADAAEDDDPEISAHAAPGSPTHAALAAIRDAEPGFAVGEFVSGARQAYEMIVTGYERGDLSEVRGFLAPEVLAGFEEAIEARRKAGLTVEFNFIGVRDAQVAEARFDAGTRMAEITMRLTAELTSAVRNAAGEVVEGDPGAVRRQIDIFTFERRVGSRDPNWTLVSTGA